MNLGIEKLRKIYPELKPAKIYFTIGALRTNGTYSHNLVLIGSEIAMTDKKQLRTNFLKVLEMPDANFSIANR
ncbi:hypothetical protein LDL59_10835 [Kaistella anthropi]|nr:hypothetical protein [Kaistella anthropi]